MLSIFQKKLIGLVNLIYFLPYYFNVANHLKNLLTPWKRIIPIKKNKGFSFEDLIENWSTGLVSRGIGFFARSAVLIAFLFAISFYLWLVVPIWIIVAIITTPINYLISLFIIPSVEKEKHKRQFISHRAQDLKNKEAVSLWFSRAYEKRLSEADWFSLSNLFITPPIGRDWTYGFTPTLEDYVIDLSAIPSYRSGLLDRKEEVKQIELILSKDSESNIILVGDEGVGKRTLVEGFAKRLFEGKIAPNLQNWRILELNMEKILAGKANFSERATYLEELLLEAGAAKNIILVIFDFHKYCSDSLQGDYSAIWEKFGRTSSVKFIAVTAPFYFQQIIFQNQRIQRLFTKLEVHEVSKDKALFILQDKALKFENLYKVKITFEALLSAINRSAYYITNIPFPEKAITLLDDACILTRDEKNWQVVPEAIDLALARKTNIPVGKLNDETKEKLVSLETILSQKILGQSSAIFEVAKALRRAFIEEGRKKPRATFLFLGPTGVGKTETAKQLAQMFFGKGDSVLRFDMSFYQQKEAVTELIGSFENKNPGLLATKIRENPYGVLLIDEIEKASHDLLNIFLTLLDEGYLVDGWGEKIDCKNLFVVATSNAGSKEIQAFLKEKTHDYKELEGYVRETVISKGLFTPEFLNRFDKVLVFEPLNLETAIEIGTGIASGLSKKYLEEKQKNIVLQKNEIEELIKNNFLPENGAREIERVIHEAITEKLSKEIL